MDPHEGAFGGEWEYNLEIPQVQQQQNFETQPILLYPGIMVTYSPVFFLPAQMPYTGESQPPMFQPLGMFPTPEMGQSDVDMQQPPEPAVDPVGLSLWKDDHAILEVGQVRATARFEDMETEQDTFHGNHQLPQQQQGESRGSVRSRRHRRKGRFFQKKVRCNDENQAAGCDEGRVAESGKVSSTLQDKQSYNLNRLRKEPPFCKFCKSNKETRSFYMGHVLRDENGIVQCPVLRKLVCPLCGATQDHAHTARYCPKRDVDPSSTFGEFADEDETNAGPENEEETDGNEAMTVGEVCAYKSTRTAVGDYTITKF